MRAIREVEMMKGQQYCSFCAKQSPAVRTPALWRKEVPRFLGKKLVLACGSHKENLKGGHRIPKMHHHRDIVRLNDFDQKTRIHYS